MTITSEQARAMIPHYTQHDICVQLRRIGEERGEIAQKTMWLVYLCATGDIHSVKSFIQSTDPTELREILNTKLYENWQGTVLHTVLYWNTGNKAVDLFELLVEHGADPVRDYYEALPWENCAPLWIPPFGTQMAARDVGEFEETYQYLREIYGGEHTPNQNASPIAAPVTPFLEEELENVANRLLNTHVARRLNFDDDDEITAEKDDFDYSDMPALVASDDEEDYSDMPALVASDADDEYDEDEYADMPPLEYVGTQ
jgi:hypothetical protein